MNLGLLTPYSVNKVLVCPFLWVNGERFLESLQLVNKHGLVVMLEGGITQVQRTSRRKSI